MSVKLSIYSGLNVIDKIYYKAYLEYENRKYEAWLGGNMIYHTATIVNTDKLIIRADNDYTLAIIPPTVNNKKVDIHANETLVCKYYLPPIKHVEYHIIDEEGTIKWYLKGQLHRDGNEPAVIKKNGDKFWYKNNMQHRDDDLPAAEFVNGTKTWKKNGKYHREGDQPAVIESDYQSWLINDRWHREGDQPARIRKNGHKEWRINGELHREGAKPAVIHADGKVEYWKNGTELTDEEITKLLESAPKKDIDLNDNETLAIKVQSGSEQGLTINLPEYVKNITAIVVGNEVQIKYNI